jgi:transcriptional regulator with XRE-family HTH domain
MTMATITAQPGTVGQLLAEARERHNHSLRRAAEALSITDRMYKQWEQDFAKPEWYRATIIAEYCGVSRARVLRLLGVLSDEEAAALGGYLVPAA